MIFDLEDAKESSMLYFVDIINILYLFLFFLIFECFDFNRNHLKIPFFKLKLIFIFICLPDESSIIYVYFV